MILHNFLKTANSEQHIDISDNVCRDLQVAINIYDYNFDEWVLYSYSFVYFFCGAFSEVICVWLMLAVSLCVL